MVYLNYRTFTNLPRNSSKVTEKYFFTEGATELRPNLNMLLLRSTNSMSAESPESVGKSWILVENRKGLGSEGMDRACGQKMVYILH